MIQTRGRKWLDQSVVRNGCLKLRRRGRARLSAAASGVVMREIVRGRRCAAARFLLGCSVNSIDRSRPRPGNDQISTQILTGAKIPRSNFPIEGQQLTGRGRSSAATTAFERLRSKVSLVRHRDERKHSPGCTHTYPVVAATQPAVHHGLLFVRGLQRDAQEGPGGEPHPPLRLPRLVRRLLPCLPRHELPAGTTKKQHPTNSSIIKQILTRTID